MATAPESFISAQCPVPKRSIDDLTPSLFKTFNVPKACDKTWVSGCDLLPNGDFVIADQEVPYVKYYDNQGVLVKNINTESCKPYDVCYIENNIIAISTVYTTSNYENILFVNTNDSRVIKKVHVGKGTKKLSFERVLVVGIWRESDSKVVVIDTNIGVIKNEFKVKQIGGVFTSKNMIYRTEKFNGAVVCCDESGHIKWQYKDPIIKAPHSLGVDDRGFVFVACFDRSSVVAISPDGQASRVILSPDQGLNKPFAISIDSGKKILMICNLSDGKVLFYRL